MPRYSPFQDDWKQNLTEHYKQIVQTGNSTQRENGKLMMQQAGFTEKEISALYIEATMHLDDVPRDFVPDANMLEAQRSASEPHPLECTCAACRPFTPPPER